jgi:hypothetical protein
MSQLTGDPVSSGQALYVSQTRADHQVGERMVTAIGDVYRYVKAGTSALVAGNWIQSAANNSAHQNLAVAAAAIGATSITVTLGASDVAENQYAGGKACVTITPGLGQALEIEGHPSAVGSATLVLTLASPLRVALTTDSRIDLVPNPYNGVIQTPATTLTGTPVGLCVYVIGASEHGWLLTRGLGAGLISGTPAAGLRLVVPVSGTAGIAKADPADTAEPIVGYVASTGGSGETNGVMVKLE